MFCEGTFAQELWRRLCGPLGIAYSGIQYIYLLISWWSCKDNNLIHAYITKCLPIIASWEIWKARCSAKYENIAPNVNRTLSLISFYMAHIVNVQFQKIKLDHSWSRIAQLICSTIHFRQCIPVQWIRSQSSFVKLNLDGSCKNSICSGGGVVKNDKECMVFAYSIVLGCGTSNWADASALVFGIKWCLANNYQCTVTESDSKLLVDCVNGINTTPWRIATEVQELKEIMNQPKVTLNYCYREGN